MYRIIWRHAVVDALMRIYSEAFEVGADTTAINQAAADIDRVLRTDPTTVGESRGVYERVTIVGPLTTMFEVYEEERIVFILSLVYHPRNRE